MGRLKELIKNKKGKLLIPFFIYSCVGLLVELVNRTIEGSLVGFNGLSYYSFAGWTSILMIPCYGFAVTLLGLLNEVEKYYKLKMIWQTIFGGILIAIIEGLYGILFNRILGLALWDYSNKINILGQVCLQNYILFTLSVPFVIWLYDIVDWALYRDEDKYSLLDNYIKLIKLK